MIGGSVTLHKTDRSPFADPVIDPAYYTTDFDIRAAIEGVKAAQKFVAAKAFKGYIIKPQDAFANATSDAEIEDYIRTVSQTSGHIIGTASMSAKNAQFGVVDPSLKVKGTTGLRIGDASVLVCFSRNLFRSSMLNINILSYSHSPQAPIRWLSFTWWPSVQLT